MAAAFNKIMLIGRLVRDPELKYTPQGIPVAKFTLAVDRPYKNQAGDTKTDFIDVVVWRALAQTCSQYLSKGRLVFVEGRLQVRSYEAQDGTKRKAYEVVAAIVQFLEWGDKKTTGEKSENVEVFDVPPSEDDLTPDDIPF